jgi:hypothetical protein
MVEHQVYVEEKPFEGIYHYSSLLDFIVCVNP